MQISGEIPDKRRWDPLAAVTFTAMICLLYLIFCGVQVLYLFGQKGGLPGDMTYAQYARQGFFQLLAVAVLNLCLVLNCLKYFRKSKVLSILLVVISLCTYVMIASAAYRMALYVDAYSLTFLRIFVLWFLGLLSILMLGVLLLIFKEQFPLFRWCLTATILAYAAFAWCRPDYQIARYNIARQDGMIDQENIDSLLLLSADAAPAIAHAQIAPDLVLFNILRTDHNDNLHLVRQLHQHPQLAVRLKARQHPGSVIVIEQLSAKFQIQLVVELLNAMSDVLRLCA